MTQGPNRGLNTSAQGLKEGLYHQKLNPYTTLRKDFPANSDFFIPTHA